MRFQCQKCGAILELEDCLPGELVQCDKCSSAVSVPASACAPGAILGEFAIKRELGVGGMGTVYLAHQITLDRDVALKVLMPSLASDKNFIENFVNEARTVASINHPNIVQAYAVQCEGDLWYFAMEYIDGPTLKSLLEKQGALPYDQVLKIAQEMVSGLKYAWDTRQMIHCDIKPDNIMINSDGRSKLADLGLARKCTGRTDESSDLYGTPQYIAPELILGYASDVRSDIYSLGATLYQIITGAFPYMADTAENLVMQHLQVPLRPVLELAPTCPPGFAAWIENMMVKRPSQRYQNYDELESDLGLVTAGQMPSKSVPPEAQYPIDADSDDPLALENAVVPNSPVAVSPSSPQNTTRRKTLKLAGSTSSASASQIAPTAFDTSANPVSEVEEQAAPKGKGMLIGIVVLVLILVLGGGGAAVFLLKGDSGSAPAATEQAADASEPESGAEESSDGAPVQEQQDGMAVLRQLVAQDSDQAFQQALALSAQDSASLESIYQVLSPLLESRYQKARAEFLTVGENEWQNRVRSAQAEKARKAEEARLAAEEAERKRKEEERLAAEKAKKEAHAKAVKEGKIKYLNRLHTHVAEGKFLSGTMLFQTSFKEEDEAQKTWREGWVTYIEAADKVSDAINAFQVNGSAELQVPGYVFYKRRREALSEDDNYKQAPFQLVEFRGGNAVFSVKNEVVWSKLSGIQKRKLNKYRQGETRLTVPFDLLLPEQQIALAQAALTAAESDLTEDMVPEALASYLLVTGNYLDNVANGTLFEGFRSANAFWTEVEPEVEIMTNSSMAERHAANLEALLKLAMEHKSDLSGRVYVAMLHRYLYALGKSFPKGGKAYSGARQKVISYLSQL